jgi:hypothetical protein
MLIRWTDALGSTVAATTLRGQGIGRRGAKTEHTMF